MLFCSTRACNPRAESAPNCFTAEAMGAEACSLLGCCSRSERENTRLSSAAWVTKWEPRSASLIDSSSSVLGRSSPKSSPRSDGGEAGLGVPFSGSGAPRADPASLLFWWYGTGDCSASPAPDLRSASLRSPGPSPIGDSQASRRNITRRTNRGEAYFSSRNRLNCERPFVPNKVNGRPYDGKKRLGAQP